MSFPRHREIYQVLEPSLPDQLVIERARPSGHALTHRLDESPVGFLAGCSPGVIKSGTPNHAAA